MKTLDCENVESAVTSLEAILCLDRSRIKSILNNFDFGEFYSKNQAVHDPEKALLKHLSSQHGIKPTCDFVCWFHLCRRPVGNIEIDELLPLNIAVNNVWDFLYRLASDQVPLDSWLEFKRRMETDYPHHNADLYRLKLRDSFHWGPYGFLAGDLPCFKPDFYSWHYFDCPEIVEDICLCVQAEFGIDLKQKYVGSTEPCIVKFRCGSIEPWPIGHALHYLYCILRGIELNADQNVCFSTRGKKIPKEGVVWIHRALRNESLR